ncbi:hypothetical protein AMECASPLE_023322 [Ameca splendens]|uniref:Uncharacterized protein n=1 Tax=Ameca splendens TaxID=208324 RepID=A0ABV0Z412_9TELE
MKSNMNVSLGIAFAVAVILMMRLSTPLLAILVLPIFAKWTASSRLLQPSPWGFTPSSAQSAGFLWGFSLGTEMYMRDLRHDLLHGSHLSAQEGWCHHLLSRL